MSTRGTPTLLGLPYDASSSFLKGTAAAPPLIRQALHSPAGNPWTETGVDLGADGALGDAGDLPLGTSAADARTKIEEAVRTLLEAGGRPIALGGDHSVTYPIVRAVRWFHPQLSILHFDAHPDLYPEFEGDRYSHACPFARILEEKLVDQVVQVGIRTMNAVQRTQAERYGVEVIDMRAWVAGRRPTLHEPVYLSIDLDRAGGYPHDERGAAHAGRALRGRGDRHARLGRGAAPHAARAGVPLDRSRRLRSGVRARS